MLLNRKSEGRAERVNPLARAVSALAAKTVDRRTFLKGSGITAGAAAFAEPAAAQHDRRGERRRRGQGRQDRGEAHRLHALLRRLRASTP